MFPLSVARARLCGVASTKTASSLGTNSVVRGLHDPAGRPAIRRRLLSSKSSSSKEGLLPPLPPTKSSTSPSKAKQDYLKSRAKANERITDPIAKMAELEKELDVVRERAAQRLEEKLNKSVYRRLTDPLRRHHHSMINVGAVLLAYILAHNLYQSSRKVKSTEADLEEARQLAEEYKAVMKGLLQPAALAEIAAACLDEPGDGDEDTVGGGGSNTKSVWPWSSSSSSGAATGREVSAEELRVALERELRKRIGDYAMTEEERHARNVQEAWLDSQQRVERMKGQSEQQVLLGVVDAVLNDKEVPPEGGDQPSEPRRVFSM